MVGIFSKLFGHHKRYCQILQEVEKLETRRRADDVRIKKLEKLTLDGDEEWFLRLAKKDPSCVLKVIEECHINAKNR